MTGLAKHMVHGEWMTEVQAAARLGVRRTALRNWRYSHRQPDGKPALLETAWDFYSAVNAGTIKRHPGRPPVMHRVGGKLMTPREAADTTGVKRATLYSTMERHGMSLEAATRYHEEKRTRRAVREIMGIIYGG